MNCILAAIDFSSVSERVLEEAARQAAAFRAPVTLLHVVEPEPDFVGFAPGPAVVRSAVARDYATEHRRLHALADSMRSRLDGLECVALQVQGPTAEKILEEAERLGASRMVLGSHGHGALYHLWVGSVAGSVLRRARIPVTVVPSVRD